MRTCSISLAQAVETLSNASRHPLRNLNLVVRAQFNSWAFASRKSCSTSPIDALKLYSLMHRQSVASDSFSILFALKSCTHLPHNTSINIVRHLHSHLLKLGFAAHVYVATSLLWAYTLTVFRDSCILFEEMPTRNSVSWNTMITGYSRQGNLGAARIAFDKMPSRNLASWSAMITAYIDKALWHPGLELLREMVANSSNLSDECLKPDEQILSSILVGCGRMGSSGVRLGKSIHGFTIKNKWDLSEKLGACLVDMYAKCGLLTKASLIFSMMKHRNLVAWTALICGAAHQGFGQEALRIYEKMMEAGVKPNELTFTGILTACVQAGLVDEGRRYFRMIEVYGLTATIQHYGCMVDLFAKMGLLGEAHNIIHTMPYEPNVVIWGSFLSSCKLHRQFEMADKVIDRVMTVVKPEKDGGIYSIISDLYVMSGKWSEAERLRQLMLKQNVRKIRGSSFI